MFKHVYCSILSKKTFNNLVTNLCVTLKRKIESKFSGFSPSLFSRGKNYSGVNAYSTRVYIRLWTVPIVRYLGKKIQLFGNRTCLLLQVAKLWSSLFSCVR